MGVDRLVYGLYGLTGEEIKVVERSLRGERFNEMYEKFPTKEDALELPGGIKDG